MAARLNSPQRLAIDSVGNIYIADSGNNVVRRVDAAPASSRPWQGPGWAASGVTAVRGPPRSSGSRVACRPSGDDTLYIADSGNHRIRRLALDTGTIVTVAGSARGSGGDGGPASAAHFNNPRGLTVDSAGRLIIADTFNSVIRVITPSVP